MLRYPFPHLYPFILMSNYLYPLRIYFVGFYFIHDEYFFAGTNCVWVQLPSLLINNHTCELLKLSK